MALTFLASLASLGLVVAQIGDAPDRLITAHGVEISNDGRVFVLFSALNALGYSVETERKGPPLEAPVFHEIRTRIREDLRKLDGEGKLDALKAYFDKNPAQLEAYLQALFSHDLALHALGTAPGGKAKDLAGVAPLIAKFGSLPEVEALFDKVTVDQRELARSLMKEVERDFAEARKLLGSPSYRAPTSLVVVPNPLDAHGSARRVTVGSTTYLVVGPGLETARTAVLTAALEISARDWAKAHFSKAPKLKKSWEGLRSVRRISAQYGSAERYLAENLSRVLAFKVRSKGAKDLRSEEEDFFDQTAKDGLRWTRPVLRALDEGALSEPLSESMNRLFQKANP